MITVERAEPPLASFYQAKQPWVEKAFCLRSSPDVFYDDIDKQTYEARDAAIVRAQGICGICPVRQECGEQAMLEEQGTGLDMRSGFRAYMTPDQRISIERRGGLKGRDPMDLVQGRDGDRQVPPVPLDGDRWSRHHTTLARKLVRWLVDNVEVGDRIVGTFALDAICETLGCTMPQLDRVLEALVQDGTLDYEPGEPIVYVRRQAPGAIGSYLPPHLR